jgi:hypothetical protein
MKRYIAVPSDKCIDGAIPHHIMQMAKNELLEIVVSETVKDAKIVSVPQIEKYEHYKQVRKNYIWKLDMTNEFIELKDNLKIICLNKEIYPIIKEKHLAYFRMRFLNSGIIDFLIKNDDIILYEGKVEVI